VVSEQQRREIHETFGVGRAKQFVIIPLGLDLNSFNGLDQRREMFRAELGINSDEILVGIVGRLTEIKNHELFLNAVERFKADNVESKVRFVVIGDGTLRSKLESLASSLGIGSNVIFAGGRRDPENFYAGLDIVALTSNNEGTPLTLIEAMANGIPVISTSVGGVVDLLGKCETPSQPDSPYQICPRGISVTANDVASFAAGLKYLVEDPVLRKKVGDRGLEFVKRNYSKDRLLDDIRALYRALPQSSSPVQNPTVAKQGVESKLRPET